MREILFRGKRVDNGEWVEGYYGACDEYGDNGGVEHMYRETCTRLHYIIHTSGAHSHLVYPDTVSQWTGLTDKNDVKVFEGDYFYKSNKSKGFIKYSKCGYLFGVNDQDLWAHVDFGEITGNKWDNPELMEG